MEKQPKQSKEEENVVAASMYYKLDAKLTLDIKTNKLFHIFCPAAINISRPQILRIIKVTTKNPTETNNAFLDNMMFFSTHKHTLSRLLHDYLDLFAVIFMGFFLIVAITHCGNFFFFLHSK